MALPSRRPLRSGGRPSNPQARTVSRANLPRTGGPRRNPVSQAPGIPPIFIRIGIFVAIAILGTIISFATAKPKGDMNYWRAAVKLDHSVSNQLGLTPASLKKQLNDLPISGVTDPKLKEYHRLMMDLANSLDHATSPEVLAAKGAAIDRLVPELNEKYAKAH